MNTPLPTLDTLRKQIHDCEKCTRLRAHCTKVASEKRRAYQDQTYWGRPVSGFGDPNARLLIVGLAPAAHGANRTGRIFTGDRSGDWLYGALHRHGFANQASSTHLNDGLELKEAYVTCVARCAPPQNKPSPKEIQNCIPYLFQELKIFSETKAILALGALAFDQLWSVLSAFPDIQLPKKKPRFTHGLSIDLGRLTLLTSYHPSQQNTFTGKLTQAMFDRVFQMARKKLN
ncbi:MAG: uracil-DNA glycosylase [Bdellovibrionales bacterium]|nr:uracil-DNA glycosylase [Bdellovibrionales bacterium]